MSGEGFHSTTSGYGEVTVILGRNGPRIDGEIPNRIGVDRTWLTQPAPQGVWSMIDGELRILHTRWRQIGMDGVDVHIFERIPE